MQEFLLNLARLMWAGLSMRQSIRMVNYLKVFLPSLAMVAFVFGLSAWLHVFPLDPEGYFGDRSLSLYWRQDHSSFFDLTNIILALFAFGIFYSFYRLKFINGIGRYIAGIGLLFAIFGQFFLLTLLSISIWGK